MAAGVRGLKSTANRAGKSALRTDSTQRKSVRSADLSCRLPWLSSHGKGWARDAMNDHALSPETVRGLTAMPPVPLSRPGRSVEGGTTCSRSSLSRASCSGEGGWEGEVCGERDASPTRIGGYSPVHSARPRGLTLGARPRDPAAPRRSLLDGIKPSTVVDSRAGGAVSRVVA